VITGVTSGLGRGVALEFARRGAKVVGNGRRAQLGAELESEARSAGGELCFAAGDVRRVADCEHLMQLALARHGRIDILINNAGSVGRPPLVDSHEVDEQIWDEVVDTNLKGTFFCCRYALAAMRRQKRGVILNIASINAVSPLMRMQAYNASKAAVVTLSRGLAVEYLAEGIRVNAILLGGTEGDTGASVTEAIRVRLGGPGRAASEMVQKPEQVAAALAALSGDDCELVSGATIAIDRTMSAGLAAAQFVYMTSAGLWSLPTD
jgi:NAD(P)-dependent dehydrogenase (short-subunit alcohol dehydrogenase family)